MWEVDDYDEYDCRALVQKEGIWCNILGSPYSREYGDFSVGDENSEQIVGFDRDVSLTSDGFGKISK